MNSHKNVLLSLKNIRTYFDVRKGVFRRVVGHVKAVDDISLDIYKGETLGLVGESGCGKTTLGKTILQLYKPKSGEMVYNFQGEERDLAKIQSKDMQIMRKCIQMIFQDPYSSLNPVFTIYGSMEEPLRLFGITSKRERRKMIGDLLEQVNLRREYMDRYPNEFSGGQRQRIGIARAISVNPEFIVCDEAVSALDASIQAQVLKLLLKLKEEKNLTYLFISHDLSVVEYISDRIAVMYLGKIVELAKTQDLFKHTAHQYTKALLSAIPVADLDHKKDRIVLEGDVPSPVNPPNGCLFHTRCPECMEKCKSIIPRLERIGDSDHFVACHKVKDL